MMIAGSAQGASLFLRVAGADNQPAVTANLGELVTLEIVLVLAEGEELGFAIVFLDTDTGNDTEVIEAIDFLRGLESPASYDAGHGTFSSEENPFPFEPGSGVPLDRIEPGADEYALILDIKDVVVPTGEAVVLERIVLNPLAAGIVAIGFEIGSRNPSLSTPTTFIKYQIATAETPADLDGFLYLGVGDFREGGVGPLMLTIVDDGGVGNDNDNSADNENGNGATANENLNDTGRNEGPRATGGTNICGFGLVGPMLTCTGLLALSAGRRRR